jgi:hypothetical protein
VTYKIIRFHFDESHPDHRRVITTGLTLEEAQEHCNKDSTSGPGWFDGYTKEVSDGEDQGDDLLPR